MCMCPGLTIWDWTSCEWARPWRKLFSLSEPLTTVALLVGLEPCGSFPVYVGMSTGVAVMLDLFRLLYCWDSCVCFPCHTQGTLFSTGLLGLWLLQSSHPLLHDSPRVFSVGLHCWCISWCGACHSPLVSAFWPVVGFCNGLCCKKKLLWWGVRSALLCGCSSKYLEYSWKSYWFKKMAVV